MLHCGIVQQRRSGLHYRTLILPTSWNLPLLYFRILLWPFLVIIKCVINMRWYNKTTMNCSSQQWVTAEITCATIYLSLQKPNTCFAFKDWCSFIAAVNDILNFVCSPFLDWLQYTESRWKSIWVTPLSVHSSIYPSICTTLALDADRTTTFTDVNLMPSLSLCFQPNAGPKTPFQMLSTPLNSKEKTPSLQKSA